MESEQAKPGTKGSAGLMAQAFLAASVTRGACSLDAADPAIRRSAARRIAAAGPPGLPFARWLVRWQTSPRARFMALAALHLLGDSDALSRLGHALLYDIPDDGSVALRPVAGAHGRKLVTRADLLLWIGDAFEAVGLQESVPVLMELLPRIDPRALDKITLVCRLLAASRDALAIPVLCRECEAFPEPFADAMQAMGEDARQPLLELCGSLSAGRRVAGAAALGRTRFPGSEETLRALLRDSEEQVRGAAARAFSRWPSSGLQWVLEAVAEGYASPDAMQLLEASHSLSPAILAGVIRKWRSASSAGSASTLVAAIARLSPADAFSLGVSETLVEIAGCEADPQVCAQAAKLLGIMPLQDAERTSAIEALLKRLPEPDAELRRHIAAALSLLGDRLGDELNATIRKSWPRHDLLKPVQFVAERADDPGKLAAEAVSHVARWLSGDARAGGKPDGGEQRFDPRLPRVLLELAERACHSINRSQGSRGSCLLLVCACLSALPERTAAPEVAALAELALLTAPLIRADRQVASVDGRTASASSPVDLHLSSPRIRPRPGMRKLPLYVSLDASAAPYPNMLDRLRVEVDPVSLAVEALPVAVVRALGPESWRVFERWLGSRSRELRHAGIIGCADTGDRSSVPLLAAMAHDAADPLSAAARSAVRAIRKANPQSADLLRPAGAHPDALLVPARGNPESFEPDLLKPSQPIAAGVERPDIR